MSLSYTDESNPFNDAKFSEKFVWHKKIEKMKKMGISEKKLSKEVKKQQEEERRVFV
jgi:hypothetical protein